MMCLFFYNYLRTEKEKINPNCTMEDLGQELFPNYKCC